MCRCRERCCCISAEETFLYLPCSSDRYSLPRPICSEQLFGPQVHPDVHSSPHSQQAFSPPGPQAQLAASVPATRDPSSKPSLIPQQIICLLCSVVNPSSEGPVLLSCMTHFIPFWNILTFCKRACFARKAAELMLHCNLMPCYP